MDNFYSEMKFFLIEIGVEDLSKQNISNSKMIFK